MRLIDADRLLCVIDDDGGWAYDGLEYQAYMSCLRGIQEDVTEAPTIDPESLRLVAHWEPCDLVKTDTAHGECVRYKNMAVRCSNCKHAYDKFALWDRNFCPGCGAKMVNAEAENVNQ